MHTRQFLHASLATALVLVATAGSAAAQSVPGISRQPVEEIDSRLLPAPGEESREFAVGELEVAAVSLGGDDPVGVVEAVVQGLAEQISFVVKQTIVWATIASFCRSPTSSCATAR